MESLLQDLRFGARMLVKNPGFTLIAVLTLSLSIGATTAIFSVVNAVLLRPLPYENPERLVMIWERVNGNRRTISPSSYLEFKRQATAFADINGWGGGPVNLATNDRPENVVEATAGPDELPYFPMIVLVNEHSASASEI